MDAETNVREAAPRPEESPLARANRVAGAVNLDRVRFVQFNGSALVDADRLAVRETDYTVGFTRPKIQRAPRTFAVSSTLVFTLDEKAQEEGAEAVPLASLRATIEIQYTHKADAPELSDDDLAEFANVNVPFNSWGYWREFVQSGLARLGVSSSVTLPLFRVQTARKWMIDDEPATVGRKRGRGDKRAVAADSKPADSE